MQRACAPLRVLVANGDLPPPDRDAGSLRLFRILELLVADGHRVTLIGRAGIGQELCAARLAGLGVEVFPIDRTRLRDLGAPVEGPDLDFRQLLACRRFDIALLSFYEIAEQYLPLIRAVSPLTRVVIDTVDVHYVRELRGAQLSGDLAAIAAAQRTRAREQAIYQAADALVAVSEDDGAVLRGLAPGVPVFIVSTIHTPAGATPGFERRSGLVFVGSFPHIPNVDAIVHFQHDTWPIVRAALPGARVMIIGTMPPPAVLALRGDGVQVIGWVPEVAPYLDAARVSIAPLRYGAGVKGKIGEALSRGLPVVTTSIGAEGMQLRSGEHALVADNPSSFAAAVSRLHEDRALWERLATAGRTHVENRLGIAAAREALRTLLASVGRTPFVIAAAAPNAARAIGAYATAFESEDPVSLVLTVPAGDQAVAQQALVQAAQTLQAHGLDPEAVADIEICSTVADPILPARAVIIDGRLAGTGLLAEAPTRRWRELACTPATGRRNTGTPRAAILVHAPDDTAVVAPQLRALAQARLLGRVDVVIAADAPGSEMELLLGGLRDVRVIRATTRLGRRQAWQLAAEATAASRVVALAPLAIPAPGFLQPLLHALDAGAALASPVIAGAAGLRVAADGSVWPGALEDEAEPQALALDCLATTRERLRDGLPTFARIDGMLETQLAAWALRHGPVAIARAAHVGRLAPPPATVIVRSRGRAERLCDCVALLLACGARDIAIRSDGASDGDRGVVAQLAASSGGVVRAAPAPGAQRVGGSDAGAAASPEDLLVHLDDDARPAPGWLSHLAWTLTRGGIAYADGPITPLLPTSAPAVCSRDELESLAWLRDLGDAETTLDPAHVARGAGWALRRSALGMPAGAGAMIYSPGAAVGRLIEPDQLGDRPRLLGSLEAGVEQLRHELALAPADLLTVATSAAQQLLTVAPLSGALSVETALDRIAGAHRALAPRLRAAGALGRLAATVALLGEDEVVVGDLRLHIDRDALLRRSALASALG